MRSSDITAQSDKSIRTPARKWLLIACLATGATWQGWAEGLVPPWWTRGAPGSTYLDAGFPNDNSSTTPETYSNANGVPTIFTSGTWSAMVDSHLGVWDTAAGGYMRVDNPDYSSATPYTAIYIQVIYNGGWTDQPTLTVNGETGTLVSHESLPGLGKWEYGQWSFTLLSNPSSELITIDGNVKIDEVTVDTYAVPEPGAELLVALGAGLILAVRRRARR